MRRRDILLGPIAAVLAAAVAPAQTMPKVGLLIYADGSETGTAFREGLAALGWVDGRNVTIVTRHSTGSLERLAADATALVAAKVDVLAAIGTSASIAAREATSAIPIVMVGVGDPVGAGLIASFARPGGNITGASLMFQELLAKQLEVFKEAVPNFRRVALVRMDIRAHAHRLAEMEVAAKQLGVAVMPVVAASPVDAQAVFEQILAARADAVFVLASPVLDGSREAFARLALLHKLPGASQQQSYVHAGFLLSYGPSLSEIHRRAAFYVDKILKGARPAELPVEEPTKFDLLINLKTARALELTIPLALLARADEVIE